MIRFGYLILGHTDREIRGFEHFRDFGPGHRHGGPAQDVGEHLGYTEWQPMEQERVNQFADATDDHQYIHVDVERAKATPFGGTIAHGYLTLSLLAPITGSC